MFSFNPKEARSKVAAAREEGKAPEDVERETLDPRMINRPLMSEEMLDKNLDMLVAMRLDDGSEDQLEFVRNLSQEYSFWCAQAKEIVLTFKEGTLSLIF